MRQEFEQWNNTQVFDWIPQSDIPHILDGVDIAITRASATTLAELATRPIHLIIIPLAISAGNHQVQNAQIYEQMAHMILLEDDLEKRNFGEILNTSYIASHQKNTGMPIVPLLEIFQ